MLKNELHLEDLALIGKKTMDTLLDQMYKLILEEYFQKIYDKYQQNLQKLIRVFSF